MKTKSNRERAAAQDIARYLNSGSDEKLRAWVKQQTDPFCLADVAEALGLPARDLRREISTRIGIVLTQQLGCRRFRTKSNSVRCWYVPPQGAGR